MRGLRRLSDIAERVTKTLDQEADQVAEKFEEAHRRGQQAIGQMRNYATDMERAAEEVEAALGQLSNMPPLPGSDTPPEP